MIDYKIVRKRGEKEYHQAMSKGWYPYLPALDDLIREEDMAGEEYLGTMEIPVHMITGTKTAGRQNAFSYGFLPLLEPGSEFAAKWTSLYDIQVTSGFTDPIKVYEYMNRFYVLEGNKRVSVMKYLNGDSILASVTRILPPKTEDYANQLYYEFLDFYRCTQLYGITLTRQGGYEKLASYFGQNLTDPWPSEAITLLKNVFIYFGVLLAEKDGGKLPITAADALLLYLAVYTVDSLTREGPKVIKARIDKLWKEFETGIHQDGIELIEEPIEEIKGRKTGFLWFLNSGGKYSEKKPLKIGFLHQKNTLDSGWTYAHEMGRYYLEEQFEGIVQTQCYQNCQDDEATRKSIDQAIQDGADLIITTSPPLMHETFKSAIHYPDKYFLNCSVNLQHHAVRTYYARMFEAKFIMGALAASLSDNHKVGYRADYPIYGAVANINAFAAGAAMIDPHCKVYLEWSSKEKSVWRQVMKEHDVTVISGADIKPYKSNSKEYGIFCYDEQGEIVNLAAPVWNWGPYYAQIVKSILDGTWSAMPAANRNQAVNYWFGMSSGAIDVRLSDILSPGTKRLATYLENGILRDSIHPFEGRLVDQNGILRQEEGRMKNEDIVAMDWLLDNVEGTMPRIEELKEIARSTISVSGVIKK